MKKRAHRTELPSSSSKQGSMPDREENRGGQQKNNVPQTEDASLVNGGGKAPMEKPDQLSGGASGSQTASGAAYGFSWSGNAMAGGSRLWGEPDGPRGHVGGAPVVGGWFAGGGGAVGGRGPGQKAEWGRGGGGRVGGLSGCGLRGRGRGDWWGGGRGGRGGDGGSGGEGGMGGGGAGVRGGGGRRRGTGGRGGGGEGGKGVDGA